MQELTLNEVEQVEGGVLPFVLTIVMADVGLISAMYGSGMWKLP